MRAISQEIPQPLTTKISLKITHLKFTLNLPGANELNAYLHSSEAQLSNTSSVTWGPILTVISHLKFKLDCNTDFIMVKQVDEWIDVIHE